MNRPAGASFVDDLEPRLNCDVCSESPHKHKHVRASKRCGHQFAFQTDLYWIRAQEQDLIPPFKKE
jgi:hypothetical protein